MKKIYCIQCGSKLVERFNGLYNQETGEKETDFVCMNDKCKTGCGNIGHIYSNIWSNSPCKRCGADLNLL